MSRWLRGPSSRFVVPVLGLLILLAVGSLATAEQGSSGTSVVTGSAELASCEGTGCTHGPDPAPPGFEIDQPVSPIAFTAADTAFAACIGDGVSGPRVQVIYAHASDVPDRYNTFLSSFRQWAADADQIIASSAAETGGNLHIRYVTDAGCQIVVHDVTLSRTGDDSFADTKSELAANGYNRTDRKYVVLVDATVYCGIGDIWYSDSAGSSNLNNSG